jgi:hypothetical protein
VRKPEQCIVGEAWGYSTRYLGYRVVYLIPFVGCWECIKYGNKIGKTAKQHSNSCKNYLEPILDDLVRHWNEMHSEFTLKKKRKKDGDDGTSKSPSTGRNRYRLKIFSDFALPPQFIVGKNDNVMLSVD